MPQYVVGAWFYTHLFLLLYNYVKKLFKKTYNKVIKCSEVHIPGLKFGGLNYETRVNLICCRLNILKKKDVILFLKKTKPRFRWLFRMFLTYLIKLSDTK